MEEHYHCWSTLDHVSLWKEEVRALIHTTSRPPVIKRMMTRNTSKCEPPFSFYKTRKRKVYINMYIVGMNTKV
jgi:hypothetical protein